METFLDEFDDHFGIVRYGWPGTASVGYLGLIIGALFAGLVYVVIAIVVKFAGVNWINKIMPAVVIGPTVAIIGLSLAGNAIGDLFKGNVTHPVVTKVAELTEEGAAVVNEVTSDVQNANIYICMLIGLITLAVTMIASVYGKKTDF